MSDHPLHPSIAQSSYWPYEWGSIPRETTGTLGAAWKLGLSAGGSVVLWPGAEPFPNELGLISVYHHDSDADLKNVFSMLVLGYDKNPLHKYQDGDTWLLPFSWRSYTLGQVNAFGRIVHASVTGGDPWDVAKEWANEIDTALDKLTKN